MDTPNTPLAELLVRLGRLASVRAEQGPEHERAAWSGVLAACGDPAMLKDAVAFLCQPKGVHRAFEANQLPNGRWFITNGGPPGPQHVTHEGAWCRWILRNFPFKLRHAFAANHL